MDLNEIIVGVEVFGYLLYQTNKLVDFITRKGFFFDTRVDVVGQSTVNMIPFVTEVLKAKIDGYLELNILPCDMILDSYDIRIQLYYGVNHLNRLASIIKKLLLKDRSLRRGFIIFSPYCSM